jgi:hypothetical protein
MARRSVWLLALLLVGCMVKQAPMGAPPPPSEAPAEGAMPEASEADDARGDAEKSEESEYAKPPPEAAPSPAPPAQAPAGAMDVEPATPALVTELARLDRAEAMLGTSLRDCAEACRALGSMKRAAGHVCEIEPPPGSGRCQDARRRVADASERVRQICGECKGGE